MNDPVCGLNGTAKKRGEKHFYIIYVTRNGPNIIKFTDNTSAAAYLQTVISNMKSKYYLCIYAMVWQSQSVLEKPLL